jgi:thioredoxin-dependent peroxiredoxin
MRLKAGDKAPSFTTSDLDGRSIQLADFRGQKLLLAFFRYASCPLCNLRISELIRHQPEFQTYGLQILAIFQSPLERLRQYAGLQRPPFPVTADPDGGLYRLYGVESSWLGFLRGSLRVGALATAASRGFLPGPMDGPKARIPADFLIDPDLVIQIAYYGTDIGDHLPLPNIRQWLVQASPARDID